MSPSSRPNTTGAKPSQVTGLDDVTRSVRTLARSSRDLLTDASGVLERELSMAVSVSERLRDDAISQERLKDARSLRVQSGLRDSAHRVVDLVADAFGVATITVSRFSESMIEQPRPELPSMSHDDKRSAASA